MKPFLEPRQNFETRPYWDALLQGKLLYQSCNSCGEVVFHPRAICPYCYSDQMRWVESRGRGTIYSFTIQHRGVSPEWREHLPLALGIAELEEGFHMFTEFLTEEPEALAIGLPLEVVFDRVSDALVLPKFRIFSEPIDARRGGA